MIKVKHKLRVRMAELSDKVGNTITASEIARATGIAPNTIGTYVRDTNERVSLRVIALIIGYFRANGMDVDMGDFFDVVEA